MKYISIALLILCLSSCKSVIVEQDIMTTTTQHITLGSIGASHTTVTLNDYNAMGFPNYTKPIKLRVTTSAFNSSTFKAFQKAEAQQQKGLTINFKDSLAIQPRFLKLEIADHVAVIAALNHAENKGVFDILSFEEAAGVITSVSLAFDSETYKTLQNASSVFLEMQGAKDYVLKAYKQQELLQEIALQDGVVFAYSTSHACWQQNQKFKLDIVTLTDSHNTCPKKTYKSAKRAEKKINYFKL